MNETQLQQTPSQTIGPFFAYSLTAAQYGYDYNSLVDGSLLNDNLNGERIVITGQIFDGNGDSISDAMIELWQADAEGKYPTIFPHIPGEKFKGLGRVGTGTAAGNRFTFQTIKPGSVNGQAPHINVLLFMRGSLHALYTRIYFSDEVNEKDPLLSEVDVARKQTLIARRSEANGIVTYHFDIHMQGESETVFFQP